MSRISPEERAQQAQTSHDGRWCEHKKTFDDDPRSFPMVATIGLTTKTTEGTKKMHARAGRADPFPGLLRKSIERLEIGDRAGL
jgi:hypothetical protein